MNIPQDIINDHVKPYIDPESLFDFIKKWEYRKDLLPIIKWFFSINLLDPLQTFKSNWNLLSWACFSNNIELVDLLLKQKINLHTLNASYIYNPTTFSLPSCIKFHMNALDIVCYYNRLEILKKLVNYDSSIITPNCIVYACEMNHYDICEFLVEKDIELDPLLYLTVCRRNNTKLYHLFKKHGCPITVLYPSSKRTLLMSACVFDCLEIILDLLKDQRILDTINQQDINGNTALIYSCNNYNDKKLKKNENAKMDIIKALVANGANVNIQKMSGITALFTALMHGRLDFVEQLLQMGADTSIQDYSGWTCLMYACFYGQTNAVELLLKNCININQVNNEGLNALMFSCRYKRRDIFDILIEKEDVDLDTQDNRGHTALIWACMNTPDSYMIKKLVKMNANVSIKTNYNTTAFQLAYEYGLREEILEMLIPKT